MSYLVRPFEFQGEAPSISSICSKCSDLSGVEICVNEHGIYVCEIPDEVINISKENKKIILSGFYETSPFLVELITNHLVNTGGEISVENKSLELPTTIDAIYKYNQNVKKEFKKAYPVIWGLIIIFVIVLLAVMGAVFFGIFCMFT